MKLLEDIAEAKRVGADALAAAAALREATDALERRAGELAAVIASAPQARTYRVRVGEQETEISEREALAFTCAFAVALLSQKPVTWKTPDGASRELQIGEFYVLAAQILTQAA